jgi:FtsP/CotA-like multicopper oxidase with cupredoxin domain
MRKRPDVRSRRALVLTAALALVVGCAAAGALGGRLTSGGGTHVARAGAANSPVWLAGEAASRVSVAKQRPKKKKHVRAQRRANRPAQSTATRKFTAVLPPIELCATTGTATISNGVSVPIWGFASTCAGTPTLPGPVIEADAGDTVTLNVMNNLPTGHTISIEVPGQQLAPGSTEAAPGASVSVTFVASEGTYLYDSAGDAGRQQAMGLYGALVVHATGGGPDSGVPLAAQHALVLSEVDPDFNANPAGFDMNNWHPKYWLINGHDYPGNATISAPAGQTLLLRYVNAGVDHNTMTLLGLHQRMVARDGYALANPFSVVSETFPAGETGDALVSVPATALPGTRYPLYNRNLNLGMMTFLQVP